MSKQLAVCIFLVLLPLALWSQVNDAGLWSGVNLQYKIKKGLDLNVTDEFRMNENCSELGTHYTELGPAYKLAKGLEAGMSYRFMQKRQTGDSYSIRHRLSADLSYRIKVNDFTFQLRERYQSQWSGVNSSEKGGVPDQAMRSKLTTKYRISKHWSSFASGEIYMPLFANRLLISDTRYTLGIDRRITKKISVGLFYLISHEMNTADPVTDFVAGCSLDVKLN